MPILKRMIESESIVRPGVIVSEPADIEDDGILLCAECLARLNKHRKKYPEKFLETLLP